MSKNPDIDFEEISKFLNVNELNLEGELVTCASYYYYFSRLACEAEDIYETATLALEIYETQLAEKVKNGSENVTQTDIKRFFRTDERWNQLKQEQLRTQKNFRMLEKAGKALQVKSRMLMSLNKRDLYKRSVNMKED